MKYLFIYVLSAILFINFFQVEMLEKSDQSGKVIQPCPEYEQSDIFFVTGIILKLKNEQVAAREPIELSDLNITQEKILDLGRRKGSEGPLLVREYLQERGVDFVESIRACENIYETISKNYKKEIDEYDEFFYRVGEYYFVIFYFESLPEGYATLPEPVILNNEFEIIR